jgi:hypothetical protein
MHYKQGMELQVVLPQVRSTPELQVVLLVQVLICFLEILAPLLKLVLLLEH